MGKFVKFLFAVIAKDSPAFALPVAVGDAHHDEEEDEEEEDEAGDDVHDRRGDRDGHRRLHLRHLLAPDVARKAEVVVKVFFFL